MEKSAHTIAQRWWRTLGDVVSVAAAQAGLDRLCVKLDARKPVRDGQRTTVGELADAEPLCAMPAPFPVIIEAERTVRNQAWVPFRGNTYSVPPGHSGEVVVRADEHVAAMTKVVLANFSDREPCRRKTRRPPSEAASAEAERIPRHRAGDLADGEQVVVDFARYAKASRPIGPASERARQS